MLRVAGALFAVALYIYFIIDVLRTPRGEARTLPKPVWLLLVILLPILGGLIAFVTVSRLMMRRPWNVLSIAVIGSGIMAARLSPADVGLQLLENAVATGGALVGLTSAGSSDLVTQLTEGAPADLFERPERVEHVDADLASVQALLRAELSRS